MKGLMTVPEAIQVLQVTEPYTVESIEERFVKLFKMNEPTKGGSYFIQCKVLGAKMSLLKSLNIETPGENIVEPEQPAEPAEKNEKSEEKDKVDK